MSWYHNDVHKGNILCDQREVIKLIDFGDAQSTKTSSMSKIRLEFGQEMELNHLKTVLVLGYDPELESDDESEVLDISPRHDRSRNRSRSRSRDRYKLTDEEKRIQREKIRDERMKELEEDRYERREEID